MQEREFFYPSADGKTTIHAVEWLPENARHFKGIIQIAHGLSEHIKLYEPIATYFTDRSFIVRGNDHLGHGESVLPNEPRLYLGPKGSWHFASDDIYTCRLLTKAEYGELPYIILGFSLGSYLVRDYLIRYGDSVDAAILVGCLSFSKVETFFGKLVADILALCLGEKAAPKILDFFVNETNNIKIKNRRGYLDWINENEEEVKKLMADPHAMETISISLFRELLYAIRFTGKIENIARMNKDNPIIFISGKDDPAARGGKTISELVDIFKKVGIKDVSYKLYEGRHRVLFEKNKIMTLDKIYDWACSKLKTEDIESMEKANPRMLMAFKSVLVLAKNNIFEAVLLSENIVQKTAKISKDEREYAERYNKVTGIIDTLYSDKKIDIVVDLGAGFATRGLGCKNHSIPYLGIDLPAVIEEAKHVHRSVPVDIDLKTADITNFKVLDEILRDVKERVLLLSENIEDDLFEFELKYIRDNIQRLILKYDAIYIKSERDGIKLVDSNNVKNDGHKERDDKGAQFALTHFTSDEDVIVSVRGALDSISSSKLLDYMEGLKVDLRSRNLIVNLSGVKYIMPSGLNALEKIENEYKNVELIFKVSQ